MGVSLCGVWPKSLRLNSGTLKMAWHQHIRSLPDAVKDHAFVQGANLLASCFRAPKGENRVDQARDAAADHPQPET